MGKWLAMIKSIIFNLYLCISTIIYASFCLIVFPFLNIEKRYNLIRYWCKNFVKAAKIICGIDYHIDNLDILQQAHQQQKKIIILSKHQSAWETVAFIGLLPQRLCYIFKKELLYIPFFGWVMAMLDMLHINRKYGSKAFIYLSKQVKIKINTGGTPIIFPEGTRVLPHKNLPYKTGGIRLAMQNDVPIITISHNAGQLWPKNSFTKKSGIINIIINPLIEVKNKNLDQIQKEVVNSIENNIKYNE